MKQGAQSVRLWEKRWQRHRVFHKFREQECIEDKDSKATKKRQLSSIQAGVFFVAFCRLAFLFFCYLSTVPVRHNTVSVSGRTFASGAALLHLTLTAVPAGFRSD